MVLVVIGLLIGLGMGLIGPLTKRAKLIETREIVKAAYESILGFAAKNKRLPTQTEFTTSLGIRTTDAYNRQLFYNGIAFANLCTSTGTYITVDDRSSGTSQVKNNVAFILFGEGENRCNQTGTGTSFTIYEQGTDVDCVDGSPADDYDDIVMYADIDKLRQQICTSFRITTETLPIGTEEMAYPSATLEATDGTTPYTWSVVGQTQGTNGCTGTDYPIASANTGLCMTTGGVISGTPIIDGSYNFTLEVKDSDSPQRIATKSLSITINPNDPRITTEFLHYGTVGQAYAANLSATGGLTPYTWTVSGLPSGLELRTSGTCTAGPVTLDCSATTPCICGTPTVSGTFAIGTNITDSRSRTASKTLSLVINAAAAAGSPTCTLTANPSSMSSPGTTVLTWAINNGPADGTWSPAPGGTCSNFTGSSGGSCTTGTISATTTFTLTVTNAQGSSQCAATVYVGVPPGPVPSCTLEASPNPVTIGNPTTLIWTISNGPANGAFSILSGSASLGGCSGTFSSSYGGNCTTGNVNTNTTFQLSVTNPNGTGLCATTVYATRLYFCSRIYVRNTIGRDIWVRGGRYSTCSRIRNNSRFDVNYLDTTRVTLWQNSACTSNPQDIKSVSHNSSIPADAYAISTDADIECAVAIDEVATNDWELVDE
jgi:type II secretory pathway pseudopilin PulG